MDYDARFRVAVFDWLRERTRLRPEREVTWKELQHFTFDGERAPLIGQPGIWKPRQLELPISLRTEPPKPGKAPPYLDEWGRGRYEQFRQAN